MNNCLLCLQSLSHNRKQFCDGICYKEFQYKQYIELWMLGLQDGHRDTNKSTVSGYIRKYLFRKYNSSCAECGCNKINRTTGKSPLEAHHIDGDCGNNNETNLKLLCPNCHSLTTTFRSLNKRSKRLRGADASWLGNHS